MLIAEGCVAPCGDNWMPNQPTIFDSPCGSSPFNFNCLLQSTLVACLVLCLVAADLLCGGTQCHQSSGGPVPYFGHREPDPSAAFAFMQTWLEVLEIVG